MGMGRLAAIAAALIAGGRPADQPAAAVQWGTTPRQRQVVVNPRGPRRRGRAQRARQPGRGRRGRGRRSGGADRLAGAAAAGRAHGRRHARARRRRAGSAAELAGLGAEVIELPVIRIAPLEDPPGLARVMDRISEYRMLVVTSVNGVECLFARLAERGLDARAIDRGGPGRGDRPGDRRPSRGPRHPRRSRPRAVRGRRGSRGPRGQRPHAESRPWSPGPAVRARCWSTDSPRPAPTWTNWSSTRRWPRLPSRSRSHGALAGRLRDLHRVVDGVRGSWSSSGRTGRAAIAGRTISIGPVTSQTLRAAGMPVARRGRPAHHPGARRGAARRRCAGAVNPPVVTLLTDYGPHSEHVGALHAVLVGRRPAHRARGSCPRHPPR